MRGSAANHLEAGYLARFLPLLERYVPSLTLRGSKGMALCIFHQETTPSLSINIEKGTFHCFGCGVGGGVKRFAELVGEPWAVNSLSPREKARAAVAIRRREAEQAARAILLRRRDEQLDVIFSEWRELNRDAALATELLALFHRRPDLEREFPGLAAQAARDYGAVIHRLVQIEAGVAGEWE